MRPISATYNMDCLVYMKTLPDKSIDLAVVDPPYGIGADLMNMGEHKGYQSTANKCRNRYRGSVKLKNRYCNRNSSKFRSWDIAPDELFFNELFRISKNQIIWGGNYFNLPPCRCFIAWDKMQPWENFSQAEFAWTSFDKPAKMVRIPTTGGANNKEKIHPTQKPTSLYSYIFKTFANKGDIIIDTHLGSGSSRIAAYKMGFDFYGTEIDEEYYQDQEKRFKEECLGIFTTKSGKTIVQQSLFNF